VRARAIGSTESTRSLGPIPRRKWELATGAKRDMQQSRADSWEPGSVAILQIRGAKVGRGNSRPVEDLLGEPMILRRVASARPREPSSATWFIDRHSRGPSLAARERSRAVACECRGGSDNRKVCAANPSHSPPHIVELQ